MSDLLPIVAEVARTMAPEARALAEAVGAIDVRRTRSIVNSFSDGLYLRSEERRAVMFTDAAKRLQAKGIPAQAVSDPVLNAILTHGALQEDPGLQDLWINLLCSAAEDPQAVPPAFPEILSQLESIEARFLDLVCVHPDLAANGNVYLEQMERVGRLEWRHLDNLDRLKLMTWTGMPPESTRREPSSPLEPDRSVSVGLTRLAFALLAACHPPAPSGAHTGAHSPLGP